MEDNSEGQSDEDDGCISSLRRNMSSDNSLVLPLTNFEQLKSRHLRALYRGEILALHFSRHYSANHCRVIANAIEELHDGGRYSGSAAEIEIFGLPIFEIQRDSKRLREYHARAMREQRKLRARVSPYLLPIDDIRYWLDEVWPHGCNLARFVDHQMANVGMSRIFRKGSQALPHVDRTDLDLPGNAVASKLLAQFAVNAYMRVGTGGALELWRKTVEPGAEFDELRFGTTYGLDRTKIPPPDVVIEPAAGDIIIFDATRIHAVSILLAGTRIACSCFIGYSGDKLHLIAYS